MSRRQVSVSVSAWLLLTAIAQQLSALEQDGRCVLVVQRQLQVVRIDRTPLQRRRTLTCQLSSAVICETNGENHAKQTETLGWKQAKKPSGSVPLPPVGPRP
eukprot:COSAG04_NODE_130_length_24323_cov_50.932835_2_plen_102_part_00